MKAVNHVEALVRRKKKLERRIEDEHIKENFMVRHCTS